MVTIMAHPKGTMIPDTSEVIGGEDQDGGRPYPRFRL
jgi:hypothetical protein